MSSFAPQFMKGKVVFVAGGTSGINLAIALAFAEYGASVGVLSRNPDKVNGTVSQLEGHGVRAFGATADVRDFEAVQRAMHGAAGALGAFDVVVSGAAGNFVCPAAELSSNGFKAVMDIDLLGTFHVMKAAYDLAKTPGASFINISAPQSTVTYWGQSHVSAAKAGVDMLTKSLALEWGEKGIRVNGIVPGPIVGTEGMARLAPNETIREQWRTLNPMRRFGEGSDVAHMALYLASDAASYVSGCILYCDGGQVLGGARDYREMWAAMRNKG